jgi:hypothetical protein
MLMTLNPAINGWAIFSEDGFSTACRVMAKRLRDVCALPESKPLWHAGRGFVVRDLPWTVEKLRVNAGLNDEIPLGYSAPCPLPRSSTPNCHWPVLAHGHQLGHCWGARPSRWPFPASRRCP